MLGPSLAAFPNPVAIPAEARKPNSGEVLVVEEGPWYETVDAAGAAGVVETARHALGEQTVRLTAAAVPVCTVAADRP